MIREENIRLIFGLKIKLLRQERGMSLSGLAQTTKISISYLNEIEKGKKYPKADKINALATALDVSYDWLVSLKLSKKYGPLAELLRSNILHELPLEMFGLEPANLLELITNAPTKLNVFLNTLIEISLTYHLSFERFYAAALRSYQEMHNNYFEELEIAAEKFRKRMSSGQAPTLRQVWGFLEKQCGYRIVETGFANYPPLQNMRSVRRLKDKQLELLLNERLTEHQKLFVLSREIGYEVLNLQDRSDAYAWHQPKSFDQALNNFKATYFAGALLLPESQIVADLAQFFARPQWDADAFLETMYRSKSSPETFFHRLTSLLPKHFGIGRLFMLKMEHPHGANLFSMTKELHLSGLHKPHATMTQEHYCRRWISINLLEALEQQVESGAYRRPLCAAQVSDYGDPLNKYFCISIARPQYPEPKFGICLTIGFLIEKNFKEQVRFWDSENVPVRNVGQTCERCALMQCAERAAPPTEVNKKLEQAGVAQALDDIFNGQES